MMRRTPLALTALLSCATLVTACGAKGGSDRPDRAAVQAGERSDARLTRTPPAPTAPAALAEIADSAPARTRLGYVDVPALTRTAPPAGVQPVLEATLGDGAQDVRDAGAATVRTAIRVADRATVLKGQGLQGGREVLATGSLAQQLLDPRPATNAIAEVTPSAVQACLGGNTLAQTIVGPDVLGPENAIGVALRRSLNRPAGLQIAVCVAPHLVRDIDGSIRRMEQRFGRPDAAKATAPVIGEDEIGERGISRAMVAAADVPAAEQLELLRGGSALTSLLKG